MTVPEKKKLKEILDKDRQHTITVRSTTIQIKLLPKGFHIIVKSGGKPQTYVYRDLNVAIDRFCEQVQHFRRDTCPKTE